jgi:hypothetical protein
LKKKKRSKPYAAVATATVVVATFVICAPETRIADQYYW